MTPCVGFAEAVLTQKFLICKLNIMIPLIVIVGPTASGKSSLGIKLAKRFSGQIVSADSRQIYRGMEIGAGTVTEKETQGVVHHLLSFRSPKSPCNARQFQHKAIKAIKDIARRGDTPFLVGGTGFWIDAVCQNIQFPRTKPDAALRKQLAKKTTTQLFAILKKLDATKAKTIDRNNPHRLIRAIEIAKTQNKNQGLIHGPALFDCLYIGIRQGKTLLQQKIRKRFMQWLHQGFLDEVRVLMQQKVSRARFRELGLHYWLCYQYLRGEISKQECIDQSVISIWHYAKRQMTWFKRNNNIHWIVSYGEAQKLTRLFLNLND